MYIAYLPLLQFNSLTLVRRFLFLELNLMLPDLLLQVVISGFPKESNCQSFVLLNQLLLLFKLNLYNSRNEHARVKLCHNRLQLFQETLLKHYLARPNLVDYSCILFCYEPPIQQFGRRYLNTIGIVRSAVHVLCNIMTAKDST